MHWIVEHEINPQLAQHRGHVEVQEVTGDGVVVLRVAGKDTDLLGIDRTVELAATRAADELGLDVRDLRLVLPRFAYRAEMDGIVEWEQCPVLVGRVDGDPAPNGDEVAATAWAGWAEFAGDVLAGRRPISSWSREQVEQLSRLGPEPDAWPTAEPADLPPALPRD